jgi:hypothetical protein
MTDFTVEGRGDFPLDMLRFDECWPADGDSAINLIKKDKEDRAPGETTFRQVHLRTGQSRNIHPKRWDSFNWKVVKAISERYGDITAEMAL